MSSAKHEPVRSVVGIALTVNERETLRMLAERKGTTVSALGRRMLLDCGLHEMTLSFFGSDARNSAHDSETPS